MPRLTSEVSSTTPIGAETETEPVTDTQTQPAKSLREPRGRIAFLAVALALPYVFAIAAVWGKPWGAPSDFAAEMLRVADVGGRHTPLVGVFSRFGWNHPGPLMFYVLAPFFRLLGTSGLLVGTAVLNLAASLAVIVLAGRRGGLRSALLAAAMMLLLARAMTWGVIVQPWNPYLVVLPLALLGMLAWGVAEEARWELPWMMLIGSFLVQSHVGYALVTAGLVVTPVAITLVRRRHSLGSWFTLWARPLAVSLLVTLAAWLPPIIEELRGHPGNLTELVRYFLHPTEPPLGWSKGLGLMATELSFKFPWITGNDTGPFPTVLEHSLLQGIVVIAVAAALGLAAWRRGAATEARFAACVLSLTVFGTYSMTRISGLPFDYLIRWSWVIAAFLWFSIVSCALAVAKPWLARLPEMARRGAFGTAAALLIIVSLTEVPAAHATPVPLEGASNTVLHLAAAAAPSLSPNRRYLIRWNDSQIMVGVNRGLAATLERRGFHIFWDPASKTAFGSQRIASPDQVDALLVGYNVTDQPPGWKPPAGSKVIARYDPLTDATRHRLRDLQDTITRLSNRITLLQGVGSSESAGKADRLQHDLDRAQGELATLRAQGQAYVLVLQPAPRS